VISIITEESILTIFRTGLKEATRSSEALVTTYKTTWLDRPEDHEINWRPISGQIVDELLNVY
jgi:hypothetical protein